MKIKYFYSESLAAEKTARVYCYTDSNSFNDHTIFLGNPGHMDRLILSGSVNSEHLDALTKTFPVVHLSALAARILSDQTEYYGELVRKYAIGLVADLGSGRFDMRHGPTLEILDGVDPAKIDPADLFMDAFVGDLTTQQSAFLGLCESGNSMTIPVKCSRSGMSRKLALPESLADLYAAAGGKVRHLDSWIFPRHFVTTVYGYGFSATLQIAQQITGHVWPFGKVLPNSIRGNPYTLDNPMYVLDRALDARDVKSF